ncbi:MAG: tyrosine-type recombinase/integrase [Oscillospiraceae bacterium]
MRMPNGMGSVYKLSGKRRNPYVARKTIGFNEKGYPKYQIIGYYKTKKEALNSLMEYNRIHGDKSKRLPTFSEVFEDWYNLKLSEKLSKSRYSNLRSLYNVHLKELYNKTFQEITLEDLQTCIDIASKRCKRATLSQMKLLFSELYKYALFKDYTKKDVSALVKIPKLDDRKEKIPFTLDEIEFLKNSNDDFAKYVYIMIYTGFRASEFIAIKREDISEDFVITGGIKSNAGKNRKVPCNDKIIPLIEEFLNSEHSYLIHNKDGSPMNYNQFIYRFKSAMDRYNMEHTPHDTRHTFVTLLSNAEANKVSIQRLTGHASKDVTDTIYTHKSIDELRKAINLI